MRLSHYAIFELLINFFKRIAGFSLKKFAAEAAYGVYVFHWMVWPAVLWAYLWLVGGVFGKLPEDFKFEWATDKTLASPTKLTAPVMIGGWVWTVVVSNLILWPGSYLIRKIPTVDQVL